jgi:hypothetical protein
LLPSFFLSSVFILFNFILLMFICRTSMITGERVNVIGSCTRLSSYFSAEVCVQLKINLFTLCCD